jgi:hypothetical protein
MNFFQVISNISHNGTKFSIGQIIEAEFAEFEHLVKAGALKIIERATSIDEAKEIAGAESQADIKTEPETKAEDQQNTWGPKKEEDKAPETAPVNASDSKTDETSDTAENKQAGEDGAIKEPSETATDTNVGSKTDGAADTGDNL